MRLEKEEIVDHEDITILNSSVELGENRKLKYLFYEMLVKDKDGREIKLYKAIRFIRTIRLPKSAKQEVNFMDIHSEVLAGFWERGINFITVIANILYPNPIGLLYCYGVQVVGEDLEDVKRIVDNDFAALQAGLQGSYRTLEYRDLNSDEIEWLRDKIGHMKNLSIVRGLPQAKNAPGEGGQGFGGRNINPTTMETTEELVAGLSDKEYVIMMVSSPVQEDVLTKWLTINSKRNTKWQSQMQGTSSLNFGINIPMMFMGNVGASQGWSEGNSSSENYGESLSESDSTSFSESFGESSSSSHSNSSGWSDGQNFGTNQGTSENFGDGTSQGTSTSHSISDGLSHGISENVSHGTSSSEGTSHSIGHGTSNTVSDGTSASYSHSASQGYSYGSSASYSNGGSTSWSHSDGVSDNTGGSDTSSYSTGYSYGMSQGSGNSVNGGAGGKFLSVGGGHSWSDGESWGDSDSASNSQGSSWSNGNTSSDSSGGGSSWGNSHGTSNSHSNSTGESWGSGTSHSVSNGVSNSESYGTSSSNGVSDSVSKGTNSGTSHSISDGTGTNRGTSTSHGLGSSMGSSQGTSFGRSGSASDSVSNGTSHSTSNGVSHSNGNGVSWGNSRGTTQGFIQAMNSGTSASMGVGASLGVSKSYQFIDVEVRNIVAILEQQNERLNKAISGQGAFFTDLYIATPNEETKAAATTLAKSAWQNEEALFCPLQIVDLEGEELQHMLYHFAAFSSCKSMEGIKGSIQGYKYSTILLADELTAYTHPVRLSEGGQFADIDNIPILSIPSQMKGEIYLGKILSGERWTKDDGYKTRFDYRVDGAENMHHIFFTGEARSGKTVLATRFVAETALKTKRYGKNMRIIIMDPKTDWRVMAKFIETERFRFYSLGTPELLPIKLNLLRIPKNVRPQVYADGIIESFCRSYQLGEKVKPILRDAIYKSYKEAGCFCEEWRTLAPDLSKNVCFAGVYRKIREKMEMLKGGRSTANMIEAYERLLDRLDMFAKDYTVEYIMFGQGGEDALSIDQILGEDDIIVLESFGLDNTFKSFVFGTIVTAIWFYCYGHEDGFKSEEQYSTLLVIEEANEVLIGGGEDSAVQGTSMFEKIVDQAAGLELFICAITQKIADMPQSIIANTGLAFSMRISREEDKNVFMNKIGKDPKIEDKALFKFLPKLPTGWCVAKSGRTFDYKEAEPVLLSVDRLDVKPPTNKELLDLMNYRKVKLALDNDKKTSV